MKARDSLNEQQRQAATFDIRRPLLIVAGAGTGKTNTLAHRVAYTIEQGIDPSRILLLTFTRRAAQEMLKRVERIVTASSANRAGAHVISRIWGGTFHATANRLLRIYAASIGLSETVTVIDRTDAEDLLNTVRSELGFDKGDVRFPKKGTCLSIYSRCTNAREPIDVALKSRFPWCIAHGEQLKALFHAFTLRKQEQQVLDYDDLLVYWHHLMQDAALASDIAGRFDAVLVDEYQDTNLLQAEILQRLCPAGRGLTAVGDDAQSIYSFRAATVHNILDFPKTYADATVLKLEQNYRSVQPILDATNLVIAQCPDRYTKDLFSTRASEQKPRLVTVSDEDQQANYLIRRILEHHEAGIPLRKQAILFRTAHHSDALELELGRRNIPFVKYGGLKFLEAAHVKDVLSLLRLAENPRDATSAFRVLQLLDGVGPSHAKRAIEHLSRCRFDFKSWADLAPPAAASAQWTGFVQLMVEIAPNRLPLPEQVAAIARFYIPILEKIHDQAEVRRRDIEQLEQLAPTFRNRSHMLADLVLDPPNATQDLAGPPLMEEDFLILSTIHSAKGCEWDCVYVIHAADGNIPSDMATGSAEEIEEERRLFYVALTRARDFLEVIFPLRWYAKKWSTGDRHTYAQLTRFLPDTICQSFDRSTLQAAPALNVKVSATAGEDIKQRIAAMWT